MNELRLPRAGQCKWAEGTGGNYTFPCRNRVEAGVSYCGEHHALVYISAEERRRNRESAPIAFRAQRRIALVEETERAAADQDMAAWDRKLERAMAQVETAYAKGKDAWVDDLFHRIVGE